MGTTGLMPELPSEGSSGPERMAAKRDRCVEVVEEVLEVEGEEGDEEDVEEIIVEEVEVIEEEEDEEEEGDGDGDGAGEAGEEDMEFSEDERGASDPGQQVTIDDRNNLEIEKDCSHLGIYSSAMEKLESSFLYLDGQKGSSKSAPPGIERSTSLQGDGSCDLKHQKSGESKVASGNVGAKNSVASMDVGAAHQEEQGTTHSNELFPDCPGHADYSLTAKDKGVTHPMSQDLSYRIAHGIPDFKKDSLMDLNDNKDERQISSRFPAPVAHPRDLSPHGMLPEGNKRQAVVCAFFAKGWCIKGKSCRFLHVKDNTSDSVKRHNSTPNSKASVKHHEGLGNDLVLKSSGLTQSNYENGFLSANTDAERWSADSYDKGTRSELFAVHGPSSSVSLVSTHRHEFPSYASALTRESQYLNNISSPISNSWNQKVKPPLNSKVFTPDHFLARVIPMKDLDSLSSSASPLEPLKDLDVAYRSFSLLQCQSSLSSSAFDNVLLQHKSAESNVGSGYGRFSAYDWEPSEPFRPSFVISSTGRLSFPSQYNPFRDSTEKHDKEDGAFGSAYASHGTSFSNAADAQVAGHLGGSLVRECENERCSGSSHNKCSDYGLKKDGYRAEREKFSGIGETAESIVKREKKNVKNDWQSDNVKDTAKDRVRHKFELDGPHRMSWDGSRESRVLRNFRVSLIELVKELLRPTWEKSLISKDVHNLIVKKSVEKVLNALEPQNVPPSEELTKQYLSVNEPKIAKMIEGYVEKYVKS